MNALTALHFDAADVRMILRDGEPWWVLADVALAMGLTNPSMLATRLEDYQKADLSIAYTSSDQNRRFIFVNEAGVYQIALASRKEVARRFAKWLLTQVLPSIRKFGMYPPPSAQQIADNDPYDGLEKTLAVRFREERLRWEAEVGFPLRGQPGFNGDMVSAIEKGHRIPEKQQQMSTLVKLGVDVGYILTGIRSKTPLERQFQAIVRNEQKRQLLLD